MKKRVFWVGAVSALLSLIGLYFGVLIEEVFPKAVYGLFGIFGGRYDPLKLELDFTGLYVICIAAFVVGVSAAIWAYRTDLKGEKREKTD